MKNFYLVTQPVTNRLVVVTDPGQMKIHSTIKAENFKHAYEKLRSKLYWNKREGYGYFE